jgi:hypothetical protein
VRWLAGALPQGPDDIIVDQVYLRLAANTTLATLFSNRISVQESLAPPDLMALPELVVTQFLSDPMLAVGVEKLEVKVYLVVRMEWPIRGKRPLGEPGVSTLLNYIKTFLLDAPSGNNLLTVTNPSHTGMVPLATRSAPGAARTQLSEIRTDAGTVSNCFAVIQEWSYRLDLNPVTGRIFNMDNAGL